MNHGSRVSSLETEFPIVCFSIQLRGLPLKHTVITLSKVRTVPLERPRISSFSRELTSALELEL